MTMRDKIATTLVRLYLHGYDEPTEFDYIAADRVLEIVAAGEIEDVPPAPEIGSVWFIAREPARTVSFTDDGWVHYTRPHFALNSKVVVTLTAWHYWVKNTNAERIK